MDQKNKIERLHQLAVQHNCEFDEQKFNLLDNVKPVKSSLIMFLSLFGGLIGVGCFIAFLALLTSSSSISHLVLFFGFIFYGCSYFYFKKKLTPAEEGLLTSLYVSGFICLIFGFISNDFYNGHSIEEWITIFVLLLSSIGIVLFKSRMVVFFNMIAILVSLNCFFIIERIDYFGYILFCIVLFSLIVLYFFELQIRVVSSRISELFVPIRAALFYYVLGVSIITSTLIWSSYFYSNSRYISAVVTTTLILSMLFTIHTIIAQIKIRSIFVQAVFYVIAVGIVWFSYPACAVGLILLLWSFSNKNYKELIISSLIFIWGLGNYYYDLSITLLHKSLLLMAIGIVFLGLFVAIKKGGKQYEIK